jgi:hypothetical protein
MPRSTQSSLSLAKYLRGGSMIPPEDRIGSMRHAAKLPDDCTSTIANPCSISDLQS